MNRGTLHAQLQGPSRKPGWELLLLPQQDRQQVMQGSDPVVTVG